MPSTGTVKVGPGPVEVELLIQNVGGERRAFVLPGIFGVGSAPSVHWINTTDKPAIFWFPNGDLVFERPKDSKDFLGPIPIPAGKEGLRLKVKDDPTRGVYHYHIYCEAVHDCAAGHSEPVLTVP